MGFVKWVCAALAAVTWTLGAAAADLTFDVRINRGAEVDCNPEVKKQTVAYFVIDCSGSMLASYIDQETGKEYYGPSGRDKAWTRERLIREKLLPERFEGLPAGTHVIAYMYSLIYNDNKYWTKEECTLSSPEVKRTFLAKLQTRIYERVKKQGFTPYYDVMENALSSIKGSDLLNKLNVSLMLFDYTDGLNETAGLGRVAYPSCSRQEDEKKYYRELAWAKDRFLNKWGNSLKQIAEKGFYEQLNVGGKMDNPEVKHIPAYKMAFNYDNSKLKSPLEAASQQIPLYASFPVNAECWELLKKQDNCSVRIKIGNGAFRSYPVSLKKSVNPVRIAVPAEAMDKATRITVAFDCPKGVKGKFTMEPASPVSFYLPAPKVTVENVTVSPQGTALAGTVIHFMAEGCAKNYLWSFSDGKSAKGKTVSRKFDRVGSYKFSAAAEGNPKSRKEGKIEIVAIDINIRPQSGTVSVPGRKTEFEAEVPSGNLKPSSCIWYIVGPVDPQGKGNPDVTRLAENRSLLHGQLKNHYIFSQPGKYAVRMVAKYKELPLEYCERETPWIVSAPADIRFSDSMEGAGHVFDFGGSAKLAVEVTAGTIEKNSIVWKADGKEIGRGFKVDAPAVKENRTIEYSVEVTDKLLKKKLSLKRKYTFGCRHKEPDAAAKRARDGAPGWGVHEKVLFSVTPEGAYTAVAWQFGANAKPEAVTNGQNCEHAFSKAGTYLCTLTCKCKKCGTAFRKTLKLITEAHAPRAKMKFSPEKASYSRDESVTIEDAGAGDYTHWRLMLKNEKGEFRQLGDVQRKNDADFQIVFGKEDFEMAGYRADFTIKLEALNRTPDGKYVAAAETKERTLRIRNHWIDALIFVAVTGIVTGVLILLGKLLLGNEPAGWTLKYWVGAKPDPRQMDNEMKSRKPSVSLKKYWSIRDKRAVIDARVFLGPLYSGNKLIAAQKKASSPLFFEKNDRFSKLSGVNLPCNPNQSAAIFEIKPKNATDKVKPKSVKDETQVQYLRLLLEKTRKGICPYKVCFWMLFFLILFGLIGMALWMFVY